MDKLVPAQIIETYYNAGEIQQTNILKAGLWVLCVTSSKFINRCWGLLEGLVRIKLFACPFVGFDNGCLCC